jgi:hypothetical protein
MSSTKAKPNQSTLQGDADKAAETLEIMRPRGLIKVAAIDPNIKSFAPVCQTFELPGERAAVGEWLAHQNGKLKRNTYFEVGVPKRRSNKKSSETGTAYSQFIAVDCDPRADENVGEAKARHHEHLHSGVVPPPTFTWGSGNGMVALWRRKESLKLDSPEAIESAKGQSIAMARKLGGKSDGYDYCQSQDHLFRVPYTVNYPDAKKIKAGRVTVLAGEFEAAPKLRYEDSELPEMEIDSSNQATANIGDADAVDDLAELSISPKTKELIETGRIADKAIEDDSPSGWRFALIGRLLRHGVTPEQTLGVLLNEDWPIGAALHEKRSAEGAAERLARTEIAKAMKTADRNPTADDDFPDDIVADNDNDGWLEGGAIKVKRSRFAPISHRDIRLMKVAKWLLENIISEGGFFELFGKKKSGKTFFALSLSLCIATGLDFFGLKVRQGRVLYIVGEGNVKRFGDRIEAWIKHTAVSLGKNDAERVRLFEELDQLVFENFKLIGVPVKIDVVEQVKQLIAEAPGPWNMIVADTLMRNFTGGMSDQEDMAKFVDGVDRLREKLKVAFLVVHHPSHADQSKGAGSINLEAAVDGVGRFAREGKKRSFEVIALRDGDDDQPKMHFELQRVVLESGGDFDDDFDSEEPVKAEVSSVVLKLVDGPVVKDDDLLLSLISKHKPKTQAKLIEPTGWDKHKISGLVIKLRESELIEATSLALTKAGEAYCKKLNLEIEDEKDDSDDNDFG